MCCLADVAMRVKGETAFAGLLPNEQPLEQ